MKKNIYSAYVGLILLIIYMIQFAFELKWFWLAQVQADELYKRWSGLVLGLLIAFQWGLTLARVVKRFRKYSLKITTLHKWLGALSPVFFYFHSISLGYGYLALLSYFFLINVLLGNLNLDLIRSTKEWLFKGWMILHVSISVVITIIMFFHIGAVFYYK